MRDGFLFNGDLLVVDSAMKPEHGDIVVAGMLSAQPRNCAVSASTAGTFLSLSRLRPMPLLSLTTATWRLKSS